jgi:hypothetical protein
MSSNDAAKRDDYFFMWTKVECRTVRYIMDACSTLFEYRSTGVNKIDDHRAKYFD